MPAMENVALWHERDISHSSVERGIAPDATVHLDFALRRLAGVIERLVIYPENMAKNLDRLGGLVHSQRVLLAPDPEGRQPRGRLCGGPAQRHEGLARRGQFPRFPEGRPGGHACPTPNSASCSTSATISRTWTGSSPACSASRPRRNGKHRRPPPASPGPARRLGGHLPGRALVPGGQEVVRAPLERSLHPQARQGAPALPVRGAARDVPALQGRNRRRLELRGAGGSRRS